MEGHGHFDDHKNTLRAMTRAAPAASAFLQRFVGIGTQHFQGGNQAKDESSQNGDAESVKEHVTIEGDLLGAGQAIRQGGHKNAQPPFCKEETDATAGDAEENALREQLADYPGGTGSECGANGKFACAAGRARKKQIGDVGASDQEHKTDGTEEHQQNSLHIADDVGLERNQGYA